MTAVCATPRCDRAPVPVSASGIKHSMCADHEREAMSCFGENWADQARAGVLRPAITGGLPIDPPTGHDRPLSAAPAGSPRLAPRGAEPAALAAAGSRSR